MYDLFLMIVTARTDVILSYMLLSAVLAVVKSTANDTIIITEPPVIDVRFNFYPNTQSLI